MGTEKAFRHEDLRHSLPPSANCAPRPTLRRRKWGCGPSTRDTLDSGCHFGQSGWCRLRADALHQGRPTR